MRNPKSEILNSKQIQSTNIQNSKGFSNWNFDIRYYLEFRISKLEFKGKNAF